MKRFSFLFIAVVAVMAIFALVGCDSGTGVTPIDPPEEIVLEWLDIVPGGFFQIVEVHHDVSITRSAIDTPELITDIFIVFEENGDINLWYDQEPNGILEPEDFIAEVGPWSLADGVLSVDGQAFDLGVINQNDWSMFIDIEETALGEELISEGYNIDGYSEIFFERRYPVYMDENMLISTEFPFVFSDRNESGLAYYLESNCRWWKTWYTLEEEEILLDGADGFYFTWGDNDIVIVTLDEPDRSFIIINGVIYTEDVNDNPFVFRDSVVYDMTITVQTNSIAIMSFQSRLDVDDYFEVAVEIDYDVLGAVTIIVVNDVSGIIL